MRGLTADSVPECQPIETWSDERVVERVLAGDTGLFEILMRRHNQRLYRAARAILHDDSEAEDVMQDAYVRAYQHLRQFAGQAKFSTWLTRIAVNEALARLHRRARFADLDPARPEGGTMETAFPSHAPTPEQQASSGEVRLLLENAIQALPDHYRAVLMLRDVEEMSTAEVAEVLELSEDNVKVRLHRARALVRKELYARAGATTSTAFQFEAPRCDRVVRNVLTRIAALSPV